MSKSVRRNLKDQKEGTIFSLKDAGENLTKYCEKKSENLEFVFKYFLISISILLSTNIYIHKTVNKLLTLEL
jgi:hypothetical protein